MEEMEIFVKCLICEDEKERHVLNIEREFVFGLMTSKSAKQTYRRFDVALTCPKRNLTFKVPVELPETSMNRIKRVSERRTV